MKRTRLSSRDQQEHRGESEEKLTQTPATLPANTRRDRTATVRTTAKRSTGRRPAISTPPMVPPVVIPALLAGARTVKFYLNAPDASEVFIAGTFNDWQPAATPLLKMAAGEWQCERQLAPGDYEYRFIVDGAWLEDPQAERGVSNPFGGLNSVISVP